MTLCLWDPNEPRSTNEFGKCEGSISACNDQQWRRANDTFRQPPISADGIPWYGISYSEPSWSVPQFTQSSSGNADSTDELWVKRTREASFIDAPPVCGGVNAEAGHDGTNDRIMFFRFTQDGSAGLPASVACGSIKKAGNHHGSVMFNIPSMPTGISARTTSVWMKPNCIAPSLENEHNILSWGDSAASRPSRYSLMYARDCTAQGFSAGGGIEWNKLPAPARTQWQHIAYTYDGSDMTFYSGGEARGHQVRLINNRDAHTVFKHKNCLLFTFVLKRKVAYMRAYNKI